jgi:hypothetical protein
MGSRFGFDRVKSESEIEATKLRLDPWRVSLEQGSQILELLANPRRELRQLAT